MHDTIIAQVFECHTISRFSDSIQVTLTERQCAKVSIDSTEELLGARQAKRDVTDVVILHVVTTLTIFDDIPVWDDNKEQFGGSVYTQV